MAGTCRTNIIEASWHGVVPTLVLHIHDTFGNTLGEYMRNFLATVRGLRQL